MKYVFDDEDKELIVDVRIYMERLSRQLEEISKSDNYQFELGKLIPVIEETERDLEVLLSGVEELDTTIEIVSKIDDDGMVETVEEFNPTTYTDKTLLWCWDGDFASETSLRFWDATNRCTFSYTGERNGAKFDNYEKYIEGVIPKNMNINKLED